MLRELPEYLKYYVGIASNAVVLTLAYNLLDEADEPITLELTEAYVVITEGTSKRRLRLEMPDRVTWIPESGALVCAIRNNDVPFIKDGVEYRYDVFAVIEGSVYSLAGGPLVTEKVD